MYRQQPYKINHLHLHKDTRTLKQSKSLQSKVSGSNAKHSYRPQQTRDTCSLLYLIISFSSFNIQNSSVGGLMISWIVELASQSFANL